MSRSTGTARSSLSRAFVVVVALLVVGMLGAAPAAASAVDPELCRTIPAPAAALLNADRTWKSLGVDGTGVRVGIISDSFDTSKTPTAADDVAAGLLPGPGNPCGRTTPVEVVAESPEPGIDEGRAMAQLDHGIAPGAELVFSYTENSNAGLVEAIDRLRDADVDVIVDDVSLSDDLVYHRGAGDLAVEQAVAAGVVYVADAGNLGEVGEVGYPSAGYPISSWSSTAYQPADCPASVTAAAQPADGPPITIDCLNFDPAGDPDPTLGITLPPDTGAPVQLNWAEPVGGVLTRFGVAVTDSDTGSVDVAWGQDATIPRALNFLTTFENTAPSVREISIVRQVGTDATAPAISAIFGVNSPQRALLDIEHLQSTGTVTVGATLKGHQADPATIAVAAVDSRTRELERFSSAGPATTLIGVPTPTTVEGPAVAGLDGLPISFVLDDSTTFSGTSAAAPTVAAVAALLRQAAPDALPAMVREALTVTARPGAFTSPLDPVLPAARFSGAGLVDALAATRSLMIPTPPPIPTPSFTPPSSDTPQTGLAATGFAGMLALLIASAAIVMGAGATVIRRHWHVERRAPLSRR